MSAIVAGDHAGISDNSRMMERQLVYPISGVGSGSSPILASTRASVVRLIAPQFTPSIRVLCKPQGSGLKVDDTLRISRGEGIHVG